MMLVLPVLCLQEGLLFSVFCGLLSHLIFRNFEPKSLIVLLFLLLVFPAFPVTFLYAHFASSLYSVYFSFLTYYATLVLSIVTYRISPFHPLAKYPGPFWAKVTKFQGIWMSSSAKQHLYYKGVHDRYGDYVRTGPNELSIRDVNALPAILGTDGLPKGPMWDGRRPPTQKPSLIAIRDLAEHARLRKRWNRAFNTTSVKEYEPTIITRAMQLADELGRRTSSVIDLAEWLSFFTFDFMGDMAFGGGFELMREGDTNGVWKLIEGGVKPMVLAGHIPWASRWLMNLSFIIGDQKKMFRFAHERAQMRIKKGSTSRDLFHHLIDEDNVFPDDKMPYTYLLSNSALAIIAGSDTTATVLSSLFFYLLSTVPPPYYGDDEKSKNYPNYYSRLQAEVDLVFPPGEGDPFDSSKLAEMSFLNAALNEAMRLLPPVPSNLQRSTGNGLKTGGRLIGSNYIPDNTAIFTPPYALHRDPKNFSPSPDTFNPDRWLPDFNGNTNVNAFIPFSMGPQVCAGKSLALVEMRMVVALLVQRFDMKLEPSYDPNRWEGDMEDWLVVKKSLLPVIVTPRF